MKCGACGYRYKEMVDDNFDDDYKEVSDGSEKFIPLGSKVAYPNTYSERTVSLYACPNCETVKIERW